MDSQTLTLEHYAEEAFYAVAEAGAAPPSERCN